MSKGNATWRTIRIDDYTHALVRAIAGTVGISMGKVISEAIELYVTEKDMESIEEIVRRKYDNRE